jgi:hypothetical protein
VFEVELIKTQLVVCFLLDNVPIAMPLGNSNRLIAILAHTMLLGVPETLANLSVI